ncbi:DUF3800 domain-containing protein [Mesorhizobium sp. M0621]|uniref:DUF3800 domain-containing protein n=1 Tax=Mesorhizobium sp. M0621 TaxID=2956974 RepID=UPI00333A5692
MVIQVFVDDSGGKGHTRHFALVGLLGFSEAWVDFSNEWVNCLRQHPAIEIFKMNEAAARRGQFRGMTEAERDEKLRLLAQVINRHAKITTFSVIDLDAHALTWAHMPKPHSEPYFWPFQNTIMAACHTLWDAGWREKFEIIYDEQVIFGPRAKLWYPVIKRLFEIQFPEQSSILPDEPLFRSDNVCIPIQAADMFAWCRRKATDTGGHIDFEWLLEEFGNLQETEYSQYYDLDRMRAVSEEAFRIAAEGSVPEEISSIYLATRELMKRR